MHEILLVHQQELGDGHLIEYADRLGLNIPKFLQDLFRGVYVNRINADIEGGLQSGVETTPALFINGIRYFNRWTIEQIMAAIVAAKE